MTNQMEQKRLLAQEHGHLTELTDGRLLIACEFGNAYNTRSVMFDVTDWSLAKLYAWLGY
jgi:hypothetical protein